MSGNPQVNTEQIARRAYEIWQGEGQPAERAIDHWRQAEREILSAQLHAKESAASPAPSAVTGAKPAAPAQHSQRQKASR